MADMLDPNWLALLQQQNPQLFLGATSATPVAGAGATDFNPFAGNTMAPVQAATPADAASAIAAGANATGYSDPFAGNTMGATGSGGYDLKTRLQNAAAALGSGKGSEAISPPSAPGSISIPMGQSQAHFGSPTSGLSYARGALPNLLKWRGLLGI